MSPDDAFEVLGLQPDADTKAIKRAYHKLLKRHKPDRDPDGFRRLREAFEVATAHAAMEASESEPQPPLETPHAEVDPAVVHGALERGELQWAHTLVMDPRWADAMLDEHTGDLAWTTRCVGLRVILVHRPAFDALAAKYPTVFRNDDPHLAYLLRVSAEWQRLVAHEPFPPELAAFVATLDADEAERRLSAQALGAWFQRHAAEGLRVLQRVWRRSPDLAAVLEGAAEEFAVELDAMDAGQLGSPMRALRPMTLSVTVGSIVSAVGLMVFGGFGDDPVWALVFRVLAPLVLVAAFHYAEAELYAGLDGLRRRYLMACVRMGIEPMVGASMLRGHPLLRRAIEEDGVLTLACRVGRLAGLNG